MALKLGELAAVITADDREFEKGLEKSEGKFKGFGDKMKGRATAIGASTALALGVAMAGAMSLDAAQTRLEAQLGNTEYAADMGRIAGRVYARGFGESAQQIGDSIRAILSSGLVSEDDSDAVIEALTVKVQSLAQTFDVDVQQAARAAGQMIRNGLAKDGGEAMDILTRAFQESGDQAGDLLDTYSEYSTQFRKLGLDGQTATGMLLQGLKAGARDVDTVADAIKEFSIRAIDGSKASAAGFQALGLNAKSMSAQIAGGGEGAAKGLDVVLDRLRGMKDPVAQNAAGVALFGTKWEDMGTAMLAVDPSTAAGRLGEVGGAAERMGETLEGSASQKLDSFKRKLQGALVEKVSEAIPTLEKLGKWAEDNSGTLMTIGGVIAAVAVSVWAVNAAMAAWNAITTIATAVQWLLNIAMLANPIGLIVLAIVALVAGIWLLWENSSAFRDFWIAVWDAIWGAIKAVGRWFKDTLWPWMKDVWDKIKGAAGKAKDWIVEKWDAMIGFFKGLPAKLKAAAKGLWDGIKNSFKSALNWIIGKWNNLSFRIPGISVPGLGQVWGGATLSTPDLPYMATGGTTTRGGMAMVGERGREAVYLPAGASVQPNRYGGGGGGQEITLRLIHQTPDGRTIRAELIDYAGQIGVAPATLLPAS